MWDLFPRLARLVCCPLDFNSSFYLFRKHRRVTHTRDATHTKAHAPIGGLSVASTVEGEVETRRALALGPIPKTGIHTPCNSGERF